MRLSYLFIQVAQVHVPLHSDPTIFSAGTLSAESTKYVGEKMKGEKRHKLFTLKQEEGRKTNNYNGFNTFSDHETNCLFAYFKL